jgi:tetratricopeptide (TPR) repeat protein
MSLTLALGLLGQQYEIPNVRLGIGAQGTIGRGTREGERRVPVVPVQPSALVSSVTPTSTPTPAPPSETNWPTRGEAAAVAPAEAQLVLPALVRGNPYMVLHRGWVHGNWTVSIRRRWAGQVSASGAQVVTIGGDFEEGAAELRDGRLAPGLGYQPGLGLGSGIPAWLIGPMVYDWRYYDYSNPFLAAVPPDALGETRAHDYSHPIFVLAPPPTEDLLDEALGKFQSARDAFRREDYARSLQLTDEAMRLMPNDPALQQFRALALFALHRYDEAAATLYAVLAVVPGWDWTTVIGLFARPENYTRELRTLESYAGENPRSTAARFVLAYHYLSTGYVQQAADQWEQVLLGQPNDSLSAQLIPWLRGLSPAGAASLAQNQPDPSATKPLGKLERTWVARLTPDTSIKLSFLPRGHVVWQVSQRGSNRRIEGYSFYLRGILTVSEDQDKALMGTVHWQDSEHFTFKILGGGPDDPGLTFAKQVAAP